MVALGDLLQYFKTQENYIIAALRNTENSLITALLDSKVADFIATAKDNFQSSVEQKAIQEGEKLLENIAEFIQKNQAIIFLSQEIAQNSLLLLIENFWNWLKNKIGHLVAGDATLRRLFILSDVTLTTIKGLFKDKVFDKGLDSLNNIECKVWLKKHGAADITINSGLVTALYDVGFAYENGDISKPNYETGNALRIMIRLGLAYRGAFMWKMQAGMGDTIFTPIYELFNQYKPTENEGGISFKFFHKVKNLGLNADKTKVEKITVELQATTKNNKPYNPFVMVKNIPCYRQRPQSIRLAQAKPYYDCLCRTRRYVGRHDTTA